MPGRATGTRCAELRGIAEAGGIAAFAVADVAKTILDAAVHPRRDVTVGGVGRLRVLLGEHFPRLLSRFA